jgi:hypothetical protein
MFNVGAIKGRAFAVLLVTSVCLVSGCGKPLGNVSGKVSYKGKPLEFGSVSIYAADGSSCGGEINADGTYLIKSVPVGKGKVVVTAQDPKKIEENKRIVDEMRKGHTASGRPAVNANINILPKQYGDVATSGLTVDVKTGTTQNDIDLQ